jgi:hypothetical protein
MNREGKFAFWENGTYEFRYFRQDWRAGPIYTSAPVTVGPVAVAAPVSSLPTCMLIILMSYDITILVYTACYRSCDYGYGLMVLLI